jgi:dTDP-4-dehydrorhamnose reductase
MLLNQCKATILAMKEIRKVNPAARLVQTEDLGKTYATPSLLYQADFENQRRWFSLDLLCGKITRDTSAYGYFRRLGITEQELDFFIQHPLPPDIMGFNYYVTSERFLDERIENYPPSLVGGNGKHRYVDTEAARVELEEKHGPGVLIAEAWERYGIPLALTEVHIGCTREEQMRWLNDIWGIACSLIQDGVDLRAFTPWSLLGSYDWNSLLTREQLHYEPGVFDISNGALRETALGGVIRGFSSGETVHPLLHLPGWWKRDIRLGCMKDATEAICMPDGDTPRPLIVIGRSGTLANAFVTICKLRAIPVVALSREDIDILDIRSIVRVFKALDPWAVVNCAGFVDVDRAEKEAELCMAINALAPVNISRVCKERAIPFMTFSTDLVFNGEKGTPYTEEDRVEPLNIYGESKAYAEEYVLKEYADSLIIRSSAFFGPWDKYNFVYSVLKAMEQKRSIVLAEDVIVSPTYLPDLVNTSLDLLIDNAKGIWHLTNDGSTSWAEFGEVIVDHLKGENRMVIRKKRNDMSWTAVRPPFSVLKSEKGPRLPSLDNALQRYFKEAQAV